jgi:hypothetical protein
MNELTASDLAIIHHALLVFQAHGNYNIVHEEKITNLTNKVNEIYESK